jgi:pyrroline-5-carboxylate reductase
MISQFLSGLLAVLALVAVGSALALALGGMAKRFPFTRLSLILALSPLSFARLLEYEGNSSLNLYAMIVILLGITIDGISHLLEPRVRPAAEDAQSHEAEKAEEPSPGVIVWEKAK